MSTPFVCLEAQMASILSFLNVCILISWSVHTMPLSDVTTSRVNCHSISLPLMVIWCETSQMPVPWTWTSMDLCLQQPTSLFCLVRQNASWYWQRRRWASWNDFSSSAAKRRRRKGRDYVTGVDNQAAIRATSAFRSQPGHHLMDMFHDDLCRVIVISHTFALLIRSSRCQIRSDLIHRSVPDPSQ